MLSWEASCAKQTWTWGGMVLLRARSFHSRVPLEIRDFHTDNYRYRTVT